MKKYRKVVTFKYKNQMYNMYMDNNNKHLFFKFDEKGNISYLNEKELIEIVRVFHNFPLVMNIKKDGKKVGLIPKILIGGVIVPITALSISTAKNMYDAHQAYLKNSVDSSKYESSFEKEDTSDVSENDISDYISYDDLEKDFEVDTYLESDALNYLFIYDMDYLDKVLEPHDVTCDELKQTISDNNNISDEFKELLDRYCDELFEKYDNIDLRTFLKNLETLEVVECTKNELLQHTLSVDSYGCYVRTENKIYVLDDYEYEEGTWEYQVIFHEISHCLRTGMWNIDGTKVKVQCEGQNFSNTITAEALNSLFTVSLFDYEENDIAYQLQSNYHSVILDCLDNYDLSDYVNHSISYYANKLDEYNGDDNYATTILELIQIQYNDYHNDDIEIAQTSYYPIYDYISDMYYNKFVTSDMSYDEAKEVANTLVERITFDVPEEYNIDTNRFYDNLNTYCNEKGIEVNNNISK